MFRAGLSHRNILKAQLSTYYWESSLASQRTRVLSIRTQVRAAYASFLRGDDSVDVLMFVLFTLMPDTPLLEQQLRDSAATPHAKLASTRSLFAERPSLDCHGQ